MNTQNNSQDIDLQNQMDLLAEGELNLEERAILFERLDQNPGGWKRCVLALLEQRSLQNSLSNSKQPSSSLELTKASKHAETQSASYVGSTHFGQFLAACLLIGLGILAGVLWTERPVAPIADQNIKQNLLQKIRVADLRAKDIDGELVALIESREDPTQVYPVIQSEELARKLSEIEMPKVPLKLRNKLKKEGWLLQFQKQILAVNDPNGIKHIPVGRLKYHYVGKPVY